jgi:hypothetical protein
MAAQRIVLSKVAGAAAVHIRTQFQRWQSALIGCGKEAPPGSHEIPVSVRNRIDQFANALREHAAQPPVVYYSEWADLWSGGDLLPGLYSPEPVTISGTRVEACCHEADQVQAAIARLPQTQEEAWLQARLREALDAWQELLDDQVLIVIREPLGGSVTDDGLTASLTGVPEWLHSVS